MCIRDSFDTVAQAMSGIVYAAEKKKIAVSVDCPENLTFSHDSKWTSEALFNLLDNAVKYTPAGGKITVSVIPWEMYVEIKVADTGKGISESNQAAIFRRFYREEEVHAQQDVYKRQVQDRTYDRGIGLSSSHQEKHICIRTATGFTDLLLCRITVFVCAIAGKLLHIGFQKLLEDQMCIRDRFSSYFCCKDKWFARLNLCYICLLYTSTSPWKDPGTAFFLRNRQASDVSVSRSLPPEYPSVHSRSLYLLLHLLLHDVHLLLSSLSGSS